MSEHTPGPWEWGDGAQWATDQINSDEEYGGEGAQKYVDVGLHGQGEDVIIPLRIDHYALEYDGYWISDADRALIAAAPDLLAAADLLTSAFAEFKDIEDMDAADFKDKAAFTWAAVEASRAAIAKASPEQEGQDANPA